MGTMEKGMRKMHLVENPSAALVGHSLVRCFCTAVLEQRQLPDYCHGQRFTLVACRGRGVTRTPSNLCPVESAT